MAIDERYGEDPVGWVRDVLGGDPWEMQAEILEALRDHSRVTVRSCHGIGKSWTAACAALWFLYTRDPALVLTTAPTHRQVKEVLWKEIRRQHRRMFRADPPAAGPWAKGELRETALRLSDERFALGLTTDEADRFQGFHSPHILVIVDEASGVGEDIFQAIEGVLTTEEARLLLIGNPLHARGSFYESHRKGPWKRFHISAFDTPNLRGLTPELLAAHAPAQRPGLVTARWVSERLQEWGEESPLYQSRVLGQFPDQAQDALIRLSWIQDAVARGRKPLPERQDPVEMGVDVARFGDCETVACIRRGPDVLLLQGWRKTDLMESTARILALADAHGVWMIKVDAAGMGGGMVDRLRELAPGRVAEINVGRAAQDTERFPLLRDELFFGLRHRFQNGDISIPEDQTLMDQLAALSYRVSARGQQTVTSKQEMRDARLASPDRADALALAFAPLRLPSRPRFLAGRAR